MAHVYHSALVPYSPRQMYDLICDVESYPEFLPWCEGSELLSREGDELTGRLDVNFGPIKKSFTTRNRLKPDEGMTLEMVNGPFSHLNGTWTLKSLPNGKTRIALELDFAFTNRVFALVAEPAFMKMGDSMVESFKNRARQVYG